MTFLAMLTNRAFVYRQQTPDTTVDNNDWNQDEGPATVVQMTTDGGEIRCYHTSPNANQTVTVLGIVEQVQTIVSLLDTADVRGEDVLALDDGRNVRVLAVRTVGGGHHRLAQCREDAKYANVPNPYR